eukprot:TRINITY_DN23554_c0_g1_i1.p1 TRINITY_DN23554_c0_g1~~TRINITY_DN23554_c0_g1_i1.p1  ORF type:complete len:370 (+),score=19.93 TRINITY_DN23554_c0_g1_i1:339-1448(+)
MTFFPIPCPHRTKVGVAATLLLIVFCFSFSTWQGAHAPDPDPILDIYFSTSMNSGRADVATSDSREDGKISSGRSGEQRGDAPHVQALADVARWHSFFGNVVLIINYNWPKHATVPFWRKIYGRLFDHIIVISSRADKNLGVRGVNDTDGGFLMYRIFPEIFAEFPSADGFLLLNDDVVFNYWNALGWDRGRFWHVQYCETCERERLGADRGWDYFDKNDTLKHWSRRLSGSAIDAMDAMPQRYRDMAEKTLGDKLLVFALSDIFYIPQVYTKDLATLIPIFVEERVRSEMAIPTMFLSCAEPSQFDHQALRKTIYLRAGDRNRLRYSPYTPEIDAFHPWKAAHLTAREKLLKALTVTDKALATMADLL